MAEVGSFEGRSALWFLGHVLTSPASSLWCFDPWEVSGDVEARFDFNTRGVRDLGRLKKVKGDVWDLAKLPAGYFDAIYVDGDHRAFACLTDGIVAWRALKLGGVLMFDDYGLGPPGFPQYGPALGIDAFLAAADGRYKSLSTGAQVIVQKISD